MVLVVINSMWPLLMDMLMAAHWHGSVSDGKGITGRKYAGFYCTQRPQYSLPQLSNKSAKACNTSIIQKKLCNVMNN